MLGVIGGTGLYDLPELSDKEQVTVDTPWGLPSSPIVVGTLHRAKVAFLARHGIGHRFNPSEVPYRANIAALKKLGVTRILAVNAVGSLNITMPPRSAVVPDQIIDRTVGLRPRTYFEGGVVAHVGMADPFCPRLRAGILKHARATQNLVEDGGTYICIEGPQFSTRAESNLYRQFGSDIIGMTAMPEARLAREAGLCYGSLAMVTDFDVWHEEEDDVTLETIQRVLAENVETARNVVRGLADEHHPACDCATGTASAVMTDDIPESLRAGIELILRAPGAPQ
jgi:5'-methylthioadenosine phosphorylase